MKRRVKQRRMYPRDHGWVHSMVVNTVSATSAITPNAPLAGYHWFVVAWLIEPKSEPATGGALFQC